MRALLTTQAAAGHFNPMAALADALRSAGWAVQFACTPSFCRSVRAVGFDAHPMGEDWSSRDLSETFPEFRRVPLDERNRWVNERLWGELLPRSYYPDLVELVSDLDPDVIISGRAELAGPTVAEERGVPWVVTSAGRVIAIDRFLAEIEPTRERWRAELGLPPDPAADRLYGHLYLNMLPPMFIDGALPSSALTVRPESFGRPAGDPLPGWLVAPGSGTTAYVTLGSAYGYQFPELFGVAVEGVSRVVDHTLVTTGTASTLADRLPPERHGVHVAGYIAQPRILPHARLVVCHGGSGTVFGALSHGVPVLVIADEQSDHMANGRRCAELGVGAVLDVDELTVDAVALAAEALLADPVHGDAIRRVSGAIANLPGLDTAVGTIAKVAAGAGARSSFEAWAGRNVH